VGERGGSGEKRALSSAPEPVSLANWRDQVSNGGTAGQSMHRSTHTVWGRGGSGEKRQYWGPVEGALPSAEDQCQAGGAVADLCRCGGREAAEKRL
jgi:hypothetical protein